MANPKLTEQDKAIVRALQQDLPLVPEPYAHLAENLGMSEGELMAGIQRLMDMGCLKRISIALRHKNVGYTLNAMVVWDVPDDEVDAVGMQLAGHPSVTHCYQRNREEAFPYNLYTMLHARSQEEFEAVIDDLIAIVGKDRPHDISFDALHSMRELKKVGMKYFLEKPDEMIAD